MGQIHPLEISFESIKSSNEEYNSEDQKFI